MGGAVAEGLCEGAEISEGGAAQAAAVGRNKMILQSADCCCCKEARMGPATRAVGGGASGAALNRLCRARAPLWRAQLRTPPQCQQ